MKRSRAPNFTTSEVMHLLKIIEKYPIIENKKTDGATTKLKQMAWHNLAAEYNSQTNYSPRTAEKLISCYKNLKTKVKKIQSSDKMAIKASLLLNAVEEHGRDWDRVEQATEASSLDCQNTFENLVKEVKREEVLHKKELNQTGVSPPPSPSCSNDPIIDKVETFIGPPLNGLYNTIYDGDAKFMNEPQVLVSVDKQLLPIEYNVEESSPESQIENDCNPDLNLSRSDDKRLNIVKRKIDPRLKSLTKRKKKQVSHPFQELSEDKKNLVKARRTLINKQIRHEQLQIELAEERVQFEKKKNAMELEFLKQKYKLEIDLLNKKNELYK